MSLQTATPVPFGNVRPPGPEAVFESRHQVAFAVDVECVIRLDDVGVGATLWAAPVVEADHERGVRRPRGALNQDWSTHLAVGPARAGSIGAEGEKVEDGGPECGESDGSGEGRKTIRAGGRRQCGPAGARRAGPVVMGRPRGTRPGSSEQVRGAAPQTQHAHRHSPRAYRASVTVPWRPSHQLVHVSRHPSCEPVRKKEVRCRV